MTSWEAFAESDPELAKFATERLADHVSFLATVRRDGAPRVHPITAVFDSGRVFVFMEPTSPKGHDILRDSRYSLHCSVDDNTG